MIGQTSATIYVEAYKKHEKSVEKSSPLYQTYSSIVIQLSVV